MDFSLTIPVVKEYFLVNVNGLLVVCSEEVNCSQAQLVFYNVLKALVVGHQSLLITELEGARYYVVIQQDYSLGWAVRL